MRSGYMETHRSEGMLEVAMRSKFSVYVFKIAEIPPPSKF